MRAQMTQRRCKEEKYDGWEDTDRCLLDEGHKEEHNFVNPGNDPKLLARLEER